MLRSFEQLRRVAFGDLPPEEPIGAPASSPGSSPCAASCAWASTPRRWRRTSARRSPSRSRRTAGPSRPRRRRSAARSAPPASPRAPRPAPPRRRAPRRHGSPRSRPASPARCRLPSPAEGRAPPRARRPPRSRADRTSSPGCSGTRPLRCRPPARRRHPLRRSRPARPTPPLRWRLPPRASPRASLRRPTTRQQSSRPLPRRPLLARSRPRRPPPPRPPSRTALRPRARRYRPRPGRRGRRRSRRDRLPPSGAWSAPPSSIAGAPPPRRRPSRPPRRKPPPRRRSLLPRRPGRTRCSRRPRSSPRSMTAPSRLRPRHRRHLSVAALVPPLRRASGDLENTGAYDDLFGKTVFRRIEDAAVRRTGEEDDPEHAAQPAAAARPARRTPRRRGRGSPPRHGSRAPPPPTRRSPWRSTRPTQGTSSTGCPAWDAPRRRSPRPRRGARPRSRPRPPIRRCTWPSVPRPGHGTAPGTARPCRAAGHAAPPHHAARPGHAAPPSPYRQRPSPAPRSPHGGPAAPKRPAARPTGGAVALPGLVCANGHANPPDRPVCRLCAAPSGGPTRRRPALARRDRAQHGGGLRARPPGTSSAVAPGPPASAAPTSRLITVPSPLTGHLRSHLERGSRDGTWSPWTSAPPTAPRCTARGTSRCVCGPADAPARRGPARPGRRRAPDISGEVMSSRPPSAPPRLVGYEYEKALGSGGFADVFLYRQAARGAGSRSGRCSRRCSTSPCATSSTRGQRHGPDVDPSLDRHDPPGRGLRGPPPVHRDGVLLAPELRRALPQADHRRRGGAWACRSPGPWRPRTAPGSSTATSSPRTSWSPTTTDRR